MLFSYLVSVLAVNMKQQGRGGACKIEPKSITVG